MAQASAVIHPSFALAGRGNLACIAVRLKPDGEIASNDNDTRPRLRIKWCDSAMATAPSPGSEADYAGGIRSEDRDDFSRDKHSTIIADSQRNIRLAVAKLGVELSYDAFASRLLINGLGEGLRHLGDPEIERLYLTIDDRFKFRPGRELFWMIIRDAARRRAFHPVQQYLDGLRWDQKPRLDRWLTYYAGADDTLYTRAIGRLVLIAAVCRVRHPGVKFDEMLVLESEQGLNKSQALRVLAVRADWFSDDLPLNVGSKEVIERLDGRWIVEAAELSGMRQGQVEHIKAFLSRQYDRARLSYDRMPTERPRQCVIVGTTNAATYLKDSSGNRRFWPVRVEAFDLDALSHDRDQLWAEAAEAEAEGESIRLDASLYEAAGQQQTQRRVLDPWIGALRAAIGHITCGKMRCEDAWVILDLKAGHRTQDHNLRLGDAMKQLGWERKKKRFGGKPAWAYCIDDGSRLAVLPLPEITVFRDGQGEATDHRQGAGQD
jgi:predicted P-loop ATPase